MPVEPHSLKSIFLAALDKATPADRSAYLDEACGGDATLRQRVEALLQAHDQPDPLLDQPAAQHLALPPDSPPCEGGEEVALDFLEPSAEAGSRGRLAHYEVLGVIGRGGMGVVLRAFDEKLHRVVAIKVLAPHLATDGAARQRFVREARAAAAVTHENVIAIHSVGDDGPVPYLVMQFIDGKTLEDKVDAGEPLELKEILRIGLQIAEGLAAAHRQGLIHRDIKPANILLENGVERVKITDFGLARAADNARLTQSGFVVGTPPYMSPEQASGKRVDHRTDLFSLGSVLYTLCAGHPPFQAENSLAILKGVCEDTPRPLREINPDVPEWLQALIARLQAKNPDDRFASAAEVAVLLGRCLAQLQTEGVSGPVEGSLLKQLLGPRKPTKRRVTASLFGAALVALGVILAGWFVYRSWFADRPEASVGGASAPAAETAPAKPVVLSPSRTLMQHASGVRCLAFSRDGSVLASGGLDRHIFLWDTKSWMVRGPLEGHSGDVSGLAFSPDGKRLASVTSSADTCLLRVWDVASGQQAATLGGRGDGMWDVAYSPDGRTIACGGWGKQLHFLDATTGTERLVIPGVTPLLVRTLSFSPDGRQIATGGSGPARLWETGTGGEVPMPVKLPAGMAPTITPDGKGLVGWNYADGRVSLCELPSGRVRTAWRAHAKTIEGLAVSPDGRFLATIGGEGETRVWSLNDFTEIATLTGHKGPVYAVAFSPDGARLATGGGEDLSIRIWDLPEVCRVRK